jgi:hypothetical protein
VLNEADFLGWCRRLALTGKTQAAIAEVRSRNPTRRVGGGRENVSGRYSNDGYVHQKYPELCRAIGDKIKLAKQAESPSVRWTLENAMEEHPAPTLKDVSRRLG